MIKYIFTLLLCFDLFATDISAVKLQKFQFSDSLNFERMELAIDRQLAALKRNPKSSFKVAGKTFTNGDLETSLIEFKKYVKSYLMCRAPYKVCWQQFNKAMNNNFNFYKVQATKGERGYAKPLQTHFTAYYSPDLEASLVKTDEYKHAIYSKPKLKYELDFSRVDIDFDGKLDNRGYEIAYVKNPLYDIWLLHVEGGGRLNLKDKQGNTYYRYLSYSGKNNHSFRMIYRYMIDAGMLKPGEASIANQRAYLEANPQVQREVFDYTPSYIFFNLTKNEPIGVQNMVLTPNRSIATDYRRIKHYGLLYFLEVDRVMTNGKLGKMRQFFINQDTGGAIRGNARADIYFGFGSDAEYAANHTNTLGNQIILIHK
jgi:membrane-bound lytic murein transglycosylase A